MSMKNPLTAAGIKPTTFRFVAKHLNHCATAVPSYRQVVQSNTNCLNLILTPRAIIVDIKKKLFEEQELILSRN